METVRREEMDSFIDCCCGQAGFTVTFMLERGTIVIGHGKSVLKLINSRFGGGKTIDWEFSTIREVDDELIIGEFYRLIKNSPLRMSFSMEYDNDGVYLKYYYCNDDGERMIDRFDGLVSGWVWVV